MSELKFTPTGEGHSLSSAQLTMGFFGPVEPTPTSPSMQLLASVTTCPQPFTLHHIVHYMVSAVW